MGRPVRTDQDSTSRLRCRKLRIVLPGFRRRKSGFAGDLYRLEPAPSPDRRTRAVDEPDRVNDPVPGHRGSTRSERRPAPVDRGTLSRQGRLPRRGKSRGAALDRCWLPIARGLGAHSRAVGPPLGSARICARIRRRTIARSPKQEVRSFNSRGRSPGGVVTRAMSSAAGIGVWRRSLYLTDSRRSGSPAATSLHAPTPLYHSGGHLERGPSRVSAGHLFWWQMSPGIRR